MPDKAWKAFERRIAKSLGTVRTPLSGISSRHTSSDTLHPDLYVECKMRRRDYTTGIFADIRRAAKKEQKVPVLAMHMPNTPNTLAVIDWDFFLKLWEAYDYCESQLGPPPGWRESARKE